MYAGYLGVIGGEPRRSTRDMAMVLGLLTACLSRGDIYAKIDRN